MPPGHRDIQIHHRGKYMHKIAKQSILLFIFLTFMASVAGPAALAQGSFNESERSGEKMAVDAFLLRPAGLLATAGGVLIFLVSVPFSALGGNTKESYQELVKEPAQYTFKRPLGDF